MNNKQYIYIVIYLFIQTGVFLYFLFGEPVYLHQEFVTDVDKIYIWAWSQSTKVLL